IDPTPYTVDQVWYPSKDGTQVSMFVVHRKDARRDGSTPTLLYGYGVFNVSMTPAFTSSIYPWLEAGGAYAVPNLRGGGEYGEAWHKAGCGPPRTELSPASWPGRIMLRRRRGWPPRSRASPRRRRGRRPRSWGWT